MSGGRFSLGANYWSRAGGPRMWTRFDRLRVREELGWARDMGLDTLRSFLYWPDLEPAPRVMDEEVWKHVGEFLEDVEETGLNTWVTLLVGHMSGQNWDPPWREGRDLWTDESMLQETEWWLGECGRRLGGSSAVAGFVMTNEWPLWSGPTRPPLARTWIRRMVAAVRQGDASAHPISWGDGLWSGFGAPNGISREVVEAHTDVVGPHVYPESADPLEVAFSAYEAVAMARGARPVLLEEFGTTDAFGTRASQAAYYRSALAGALLGGALGAWGWCLTDFKLPHDAPYSHHAFELRFGLVTEDGVPKETSHAMRAFRPVADGFGPVATDPVAVLVPAVQSGDMPFPRGPEAPLVTGVARRMLRQLAQLGYNPRVVREPMPVFGQVEQPDVAIDLSDVRLVFCAAPRVGEPLREQLWDWVAAGGHLYLAYSDSPWWPDPEEQVGVSFAGPYGWRPRLDGEHVWRWGSEWRRIGAREVPYRRAGAWGRHRRVFGGRAGAVCQAAWCGLHDVGRCRARTHPGHPARPLPRHGEGCRRRSRRGPPARGNAVRAVHDRKSSGGESRGGPGHVRDEDDRWTVVPDT